MQRTLKRELKVLEIVKRERIKTNVSQLVNQLNGCVIDDFQEGDLISSLEVICFTFSFDALYLV